MPMPDYLYHATPKTNAQGIVDNGLEPRSVGGEDTKYLCMSGTEDGAVTLGARANDVIFRVNSSLLTAGLWGERGAGKKEWRGTEKISADFLEYRRNLAKTGFETAWRDKNEYPIGI